MAVFADPDEKTAKVVVPDYQLSLAIGKEGQNARLAARLTGYKIDIKSETQAKDAPGFRYEDYLDDFDDEEYEEDYDGYEESYEEAPADGEMLPDEEMSDGKENFPEEDMIPEEEVPEDGDAPAEEDAGQE